MSSLTVVLQDHPFLLLKSLAFPFHSGIKTTWKPRRALHVPQALPPSALTCYCICVSHGRSIHFHSWSWEYSSKPKLHPFFPDTETDAQEFLDSLPLIQLLYKLSFTLAIAFRTNTSECYHYYCLVGFLLKNNAILPPSPNPQCTKTRKN